MTDENEKRDITDFWASKVKPVHQNPAHAEPEDIDTERQLPSPRFPIGAPQPMPSVNNRNAPVLQDFGATVEEDDAADSDQVTLDDMLTALISLKGSDLHLKHGKPPMARIRGGLKSISNFPVLSSEDIDLLLREQMTDDQEYKYETSHELDFAYEIPGRSRFRVNAAQERRHARAVFRTIPTDIKSLGQLNMPDVLNEFAGLPRGLVLVTGPTGSGKSTTLAAIIDQANRTREDHIVTIEDPIEFVHKDIKCIVTQREVGVDTESFGEALKHALRQDPDIVLVGEMRDLETISTAITAAETGHLVFGTLHTQSAATSINRIIDVFPAGQQAQVQAQLASTLQAIVSQTLIPSLDGTGRVAAVEILRNTTGVRNQIRHGKVDQIASEIQTGKSIGMQTLDMHLEELVRKNKIGIDDALLKAAEPRTLEAKFGGDNGIAQIRRQQQYRASNSEIGGIGSGNISLR